MSAWPFADHEQVGKNEKWWLWQVRDEPAESRPESAKWLFKPNREGGRSGEDWPEKVVSELGGLLGIPCADIELAVWNGKNGIISRNVRPDGWALQSGSLALADIVPGYVGGKLKPKGRPGHSLRNIMRLLADHGPPPGSNLSSAHEAFAAFLTLDALVANTDRHDENWAVLRSTAGEDALAASFDHATSFGSGLSDVKRASILCRPGGARHWALAGRARTFEHDRLAPGSASTLVELAHTALDRLPSGVRAGWLERVEAVDDDAVRGVISRVGGLSDLTATFILEITAINRRRLLDDRR